MGAIQGAVNSLLGTGALAVGAGKKVLADNEKTATDLQKQYLDNKKEVIDIIHNSEIDKFRAANYTGQDQMFAKVSLENAKEKVKAITEMNDRIEKRFKTLTHRDIIGGEK